MTLKGLYAAFFMLHASFLISSCSSDELDPTSIFENQMTEAQQASSPFDKWIVKHYVKAYNIDLKYRLDDIETDYTYNLVPADQSQAIRMAHAVLYGWLQAYDETSGVDFTRQYVPKLIHLVGSYAFTKKGTTKLGTAEDGLKVTLYGVNNFSTSEATLNDYFQIMHHEFTHILAHNKEYDTAFRLISDGSYVTGEWTSKTETEALQAGFINTYAMSEYNEDFAETLSFYLIYTPAKWREKMNTAGSDGEAVISRKLAIVRAYMLSAWDIDIDQLRDILQRRISDIVSGQVDLDDVSV